MPKESKQVKLIVIPKDFSLNIMTLLHNGDHLSVKQMIKDSK
jgi:uncharacterized phage infection (PIP) family protein YhgE